jgi:hypothetical protein
VSVNQALQRERLENLLADLPEALLERADAEHQKFRTAFQAGQCYLCGYALTDFVAAKPCPHWLLKPAGFKKRFFQKLVEQFGYFDIQQFLRWAANEGEFATNINDLPVEGDGKMLATTIVYGDLEWSFSCTESDFAGHAKTQNAKHPHYHFQMRVRKQPFIYYNDFHAPFSDKDMVKLKAEQAKPSKRLFPHGEGMHDILNQDRLEDFVKLPTDKAPDNPRVTVDAWAESRSKQGFKSEDVMAAVRHAVKTGARPAAGLLNLKDATVRAVVRPAPGMTPLAKREGGRGNSDDN